MKSEILNRLLSRKLWIAIFTMALLALNEQWNELVIVALGYMGVQGISEAVTGRPTTQVVTENTMSQNDDVDRDVILTGQELDR